MGIIVDIKAVVEWWLIAYFSTCLLFVKTLCVGQAADEAPHFTVEEGGAD